MEAEYLTIVIEGKRSICLVANIDDAKYIANIISKQEHTWVAVDKPVKVYSNGHAGPDIPQESIDIKQLLRI